MGQAPGESDGLNRRRTATGAALHTTGPRTRGPRQGHTGTCSSSTCHCQRERLQMARAVTQHSLAGPFGWPLGAVRQPWTGWGTRVAHGALDRMRAERAWAASYAGTCDASITRRSPDTFDVFSQAGPYRPSAVEAERTIIAGGGRSMDSRSGS